MTFEHGAIAHNMLTGHGFAMNWPYTSPDTARQRIMDEPPTFESSYQPPVNPYVMFGAYKIFGESPAAYLFLMLLYATCNALLPVIQYCAVKEFARDSVARSAAIISAFFLPAAFSVTTFSGSPLYMVAVAALMLYAVKISRDPSWKNYLLFGLLSGISMLMRSELFALGFVLLAVAAGLSVRRAKQRGILQRSLVAALCSIAVIAPWTIRNYELFHKFVPTVDRPWHEIWRGNNPFSTPSGMDSTNTGVWLGTRLFPSLVRTADSIPYDQYFVIRLDSVFKHEALTYIGAHPMKTIALGLRKIGMLLTVSVNFAASTQHGFAWLYPPFMLALTIPTILGLVFLLRQRANSDLWNAGVLYGLFLLYYCAISFITFVIPRYQIYVFAVLIPVATIGYDAVLSAYKKRRAARLQPA